MSIVPDFANKLTSGVSNQSHQSNNFTNLQYLPLRLNNSSYPKSELYVVNNGSLYQILLGFLQFFSALYFDNSHNYMYVKCHVQRLRVMNIVRRAL